MEPIELSSTPVSWAPSAGGRTTRAWSIPGTRKSCMYVCSPVTLAGTSGRGSDLPTTVYSAGFFSGAFLSSLRWNSWSPISSAYEALFVMSALTRTMPNFTSSSPDDTPSRAAARSTSALRAVAAAWLIWTPPTWTERLPHVGPWSGVSAVSPSTRLIRSTGTSSSSAAI